MGRSGNRVDVVRPTARDDRGVIIAAPLALEYYQSAHYRESA
jgi:hypothetical protein